MRHLMVRPRFNGMTRELDRFFDDWFTFPNVRSESEVDFSPRVDIRETEDDVVLTFEVPGMDKKDIKVTVKDNVLTVSGNRNSESEDKQEGWVRREIYSGAFSRSFTLPDKVNTEKVAADYRNGMLVVSLPKLEEVKPKEIEVKLS